MNSKSVFLAALCAAMTLTASAKVADELAIGAKAPKADIKLTDVSGKPVALASVAGENGLLVVFSCNTCPYVVASEKRYLAISKVCRENKVGMVLVNSNEAQHDTVDSMDAMKAHAKKNKYDFPYVLDTDAVLANAFGATRTPHVFLLNKSLNLVYRGAVDDSVMDESQVTKTYLSDAITNLATGKVIDPAATKSIGCSIKRSK